LLLKNEHKINPDKSGQIQWELWEVRGNIQYWISGGKDRATRRLARGKQELYFLESQEKFCGTFRFLPPVNDPLGEISGTHEQPS
jgi:hypothetical protein